MLRDFWRKGRNAVERGAGEPPFAFAIPEGQPDRRSLAMLVNLLRDHGIEVSRAPEPFEVAGRGMPAGTFVVRLDQPYRGYAIDLLEAQRFPAEEAQHEPYDDVSWALPVQFGIDVVRVDDPQVREVPLELVTSEVAYAGEVSGEGPVFLLRDVGEEALLVARHRLSGHRVMAAERAFSHAGSEYPAGSWILDARPGLADALPPVAAELALDFSSAATVPDVPVHELDLPRLAVMATWQDTESAGWVRLLFDRERIPYSYIKDDDIRRGGLEDRFDVLVYPHTYESLRDVIQGIDSSHGPLAYTRTDEFPSHGSPKASPDITGGLGFEGLANLKTFVERGGVLITLGGASTVPLDGGFVRHVRRARVEELHTAGLEIRARFLRPDHPLAYGYPEVTSVHRTQLPLYETREAELGWVILHWGTEPPRYDDPKSDNDGPWGVVNEVERSEKGKQGEKENPPLVVSGGMKGEDEIQGKPAVVDIPVGDGRVVAFNFDPIHRTVTRSDFRLVWNVILNWNDLPPTQPNPPRVTR
jgi:hypothetical protein